MRVMLLRLAGLLAWYMIIAYGAKAQSPHGALKIECQACHNTASWTMRRDASFNHSSTGFGLTGQHQTVRCERCHNALKFTAVSARCFSCHVDVHRDELGADCERCHTAQSWRIVDMVQRHQQTSFALLGRHSAIDCQLCHSDGAIYRFVGTPTTCIGCHRNDYQTTIAPDHVSGHFSTDCARCHRVTAFDWRGSFDHEATAFPLTGSHRATPCVSCHQGQVFGPLPTECVACHQADYVSTTNPNHAAANFPSACHTCHSTTAWTPSTFDHDQQFFRIYSGKHRNKWALCADCHQNGGTLSDFTCMLCHEHRQSAMDSKHAQVSGYVYASPACYSCHRGV